MIAGVLDTTNTGVGPNPASAPLTTAAVKNVLASAADAIWNSAAPSISTQPQKAARLYSLASSAASALIPSTVPNSVENLDALATSLTNPYYQSATAVQLQTMLLNIRTAAGVAANTLNYGAIAQGALRNPGNRTGAGYAAINAGLANDPYVADLVSAYIAFTTPAAVNTLGALDPVAVAAAGALKFPGSAGTIAVYQLDNTPGLTNALAKDIVNRSVGANQTGATGVAAAVVGHGLGAFPPLTPGDITSAVITAAPISSAGAIARQVLSTAGAGVSLNVTQVAGEAIKAAADISPR